MRIINQTRNTVIAENAGLADDFFSRAKGLLGRENLNPGEALIIIPCNSIHTFFMRFSIDCLFVDKNNRIIKTLPNFKPFQISPVCWQSHLVIELPVGTIAKTSSQTGDIIVQSD